MNSLYLSLCVPHRAQSDLFSNFLIILLLVLSTLYNMAIDSNVKLGYNYTRAHLPHNGLCVLSNWICVPNLVSTALKPNDMQDYNMHCFSPFQSICMYTWLLWMP